VSHRWLIIHVGLVLLGFVTGSAGAGLRAYDLRCERLTSPMGIDAVTPRLSWKLAPRDAGARGQSQTAYRVIVASSPEALSRDRGDLWDSGVVRSARQLDVVYAGRPLDAGQPCWWKVRVWHGGEQPGAWSDAARWSIGLPSRADWGDAQWIAHPEVLKKWADHPRQEAHIAAGGNWTTLPATGGPAAMLRRTFDLDRPVARATLYVTALGLYEVRLNGRRIGERMLSPEWTDYDHRVQYQTYDVTKRIRAGHNAIGAVLGDGWYAGAVAPPLNLRAFSWGTAPRLLLRLEIEHARGGHTTIVSDGSWRATLDGPNRMNGLYHGVVYNARREMPGWDEPGFDDEAWPAVALGGDDRNRAIVAQMTEPIRIRHELTPEAITEPAPGVYIADFGRNQTGIVRLNVTGPAGATVTLRFAEALRPDGHLDVRSMRGLKATYRYTLRGDGDTENWTPRFTFCGFRYVELTGLPQPPTPATLTALSLSSDLPIAGEFACSSDQINRIVELMRHTLHSNLLSVPMDCPQRPERLGWLGDAQTASQAMCFDRDMATFLKKWLADVRDGRNAAGGFPDFAPTPPHTRHHYARHRYWFTPGWADAGVIVPWRAWVNYADRTLLEAQYPAASRYVDAVIDANPDGPWRQRRGGDWGDWLATDKAEWDLFCDAFHAHDCDLMARMASALGRDDDARRYRERFELARQAFNRTWVKPDGTVGRGTQSAQAYALQFGLLDEPTRSAALRKLASAVEREGLTTGIHSTHRMMLALSDAGRDDLSYDVILQRRPPSWGYMLDQGATTLWESWDALEAGKSLNHYALGAVVEWIWRTVVGLHPLEGDGEVGYRHVLIRPAPSPQHGVTSASGRYESVRGPLSVDWKLTDAQFTIRIELPPNVQATAVIPAANDRAVLESGAPLAVGPGIRHIERGPQTVTVTLGSGSYTFTSTWPTNAPPR